MANVAMIRPKRERIVENVVVKDEDEESDDDDLSSHNLLHPEVQNNDSACEDLSDDDNQDENNVPLAEGLMQNMTPRIRNFLLRFASGCCLIGGFSLLVAIGPVGLIFLGYAVLIKSYKEVIGLGYKMCHIKDSETKKFCWFIFWLLIYHMIGVNCFSAILSASSTLGLPLVMMEILKFLIRFNTVIEFVVYFSSIVWFVSSMNDGNYLGRYAILAWSHTSSFFTVIPVHLLYRTFLEGGMIFYVVPMIVITINDIMAFYVGFYFGKTPLIKLSPKKTLEGYLGGGFLTLIMGTAFSVFCSTFHPTLICPIKVDVAALSWNVLEVRNLFTVTECVRPILFEPQHVQVLSYSMMISPFVIHSFIISLFAAVLGPFGGFFASGFKRACNKKNFGSLIPGHGGVLDRCDCMFLMAAFSHAYFEYLKQLGLTSHP